MRLLVSCESPENQEKALRLAEELELTYLPYKGEDKKKYIDSYFFIYQPNSSYIRKGLGTPTKEIRCNFTHWSNSFSDPLLSKCLKGLPNRFVYGASKAAIIGLTKSIASDFVKQNIRCNSIAPGTVFSPSWQDRVNQSPDPVQAKKDFIARQPMGRLGTAEEIAAMAIYLAGDESTFTTGNTFSVDGGMTI